MSVLFAWHRLAVILPSLPFPLFYPGVTALLEPSSTAQGAALCCEQGYLLGSVYDR
jgi:hypothetical protein